jgi:hypothetical protein
MTTGVLKQIGVFGGRVYFSSLMYYTLQSNLLVIVLFAMLTFRTMKELRTGTRGGNGFYARFEMVCVVDILLTFGVFWILLMPGTSAEFIRSFENLSTHTITPLLCLADYLIFTKGRTLKYRDVFYTCIFPLAYVIFSAIAGIASYVYRYADTELGAGFPVHAPYFFLDYWTIGAQSAIYIIAIMLLIVLVAHLFYWIDRKVKKRMDGAVISE